MLQDYKLGVRMLLKYPGLTIAGGLALAIAIGIGAGWYDLWGKILWPTIPLPDGAPSATRWKAGSDLPRRSTPCCAPPDRRSCHEMA